MDIKSLIAAEDVLTSEMGSIYGGKEPIKKVESTSPENPPMTQSCIILKMFFNICQIVK